MGLWPATISTTTITFLGILCFNAVSFSGAFFWSLHNVMWNVILGFSSGRATRPEEHNYLCQIMHGFNLLYK